MAAAADDHDALLTPEDLCEREVISPSTARAWRASGAGPPFIKLSPRLVRYRLVDVLQWERSRLRRSTADAGRPPLLLQMATESTERIRF